MTNYPEIKPCIEKRLRSRYSAARSFLELEAICPHCGEMAEFKPIASNMIDGRFSNKAHAPSQCTVHVAKCASCHGGIIGIDELNRTQVLWPRETWRDKAPAGVDPHALADYREAVAVLPYSEQCAALLARRSLLRVLRVGLKVKRSKLAFQMQEAAEHEGLSEETRTALKNMLSSQIVGPPMDDEHLMKRRSDPALFMLRMQRAESRFTLRTLEMVFFDLYPTDTQQEEFAPLRAAG